ncbi:response regulator transcription factor [Burkholderia contaminans]|uniref:response regulator transcription factor n=1 Tax=Burkholderia contaminans TaxID=488447 RepID=UPI001453A11E|nr:response regulator transcription factor [Burkholderia contaminans]VWC74664.1 LuxR family transcriptional regulator [Burkholderia contaminans]
MNSLKIRLAIADDHPVLLYGVQHALSDIPTIQVVGSARNSTELIELLERSPCDVLMTDYAMPGGEYGDGLSMLALLRRRFPLLKIMVLTAGISPAIVSEIARIGIRSVLNKMDDIGHLITAIHTVFAGAAYYSPGAQRLLHAAPSDYMPDTMSATTLTKREAEVLRLYVAGMSINEIATQMRRTKQTISAQKQRAMRKLGVDRDVDLFRAAYEMGFGTAVTESQCESSAPWQNVGHEA